MNELTARFKVQFGTGRHRAADVGPRSQTGPAVGDAAKVTARTTHGGTSRPVSRVARMLALAYAIERMVDAGGLKDYAAAARRLGMTRARVTQVLNLLNLAPGVQEAILTGELALSERDLRSIALEPSWKAQEPMVGAGSKSA